MPVRQRREVQEVLYARPDPDRGHEADADHDLGVLSAAPALVLQMVEYGIIEPQRTGAEPEFHGEALVRAQVAARLMRDLKVNLAGAALAIDLLRQLGRL